MKGKKLKFNDTYYDIKIDSSTFAFFLYTIDSFFAQ